MYLFIFDFLFRQILKNNTNLTSSLNIYSIEETLITPSSIIDLFNNVLDDVKIGNLIGFGLILQYRILCL